MLIGTSLGTFYFCNLCLQWKGDLLLSLPESNVEGGGRTTAAAELGGRVGGQAGKGEGGKEGAGHLRVKV